MKVINNKTWVLVNLYTEKIDMEHLLFACESLSSTNPPTIYVITEEWQALGRPERDAHITAYSGHVQVTQEYVRSLVKQTTPTRRTGIKKKKKHAQKPKSQKTKKGQEVAATTP